MKRFLTSTIIIFTLLLVVSCGNNGTYYEQMTHDKPIALRIKDLNKTIDQIRKEEKGKLINDGDGIIKFVYDIGENDTYIITYLFDDKGCYEINIDSYFAQEEDAQNVVDGIRSEINATDYGAPEEDNNLCRWKNKERTVSLELDYKNVSRGLIIITIFATD